MKPIVGIIPLWDDEKDSLWMLPGYMDGIREAGCIPIMFPLTGEEKDLERLMDMVDGVIFTGGQDVDPEIYGEVALDGMIEGCPARDVMEKIVLEKALRDDKAVLGICRGLQFINACLGGSLYQDLPTQKPSEICHRQKAPYDVPIHTVIIKEGSELQKVLGLEELAVNSCHHQAIKALAPGLVNMAESPDGLIEAFSKPGQKFFWALQWHPEFSYQADENSRKIFAAFAQSMNAAQ